MARGAVAPLAAVAFLASLAAATALSGSGYVASAATGANTFSVAATFDTALYLHDDPSPPTADSASQNPLTFDATAPTAVTLFNYDSDRDAHPGLVVQKGTGINETDPVKMARWLHVPSSSLVLSGPVSVTLWTAMKDFASGKQGHVVVGLYDCSTAGDSCTTLSTSSRAQSPWPTSWQSMVFTLGTLNHAVAASRSLVLKVAVGTSSDDDLWFAYDTTTYPARLTVSA